MSSSIQSFGKGALRVAKNYTKGYSDTQTKVREATSNDAWGPSGTQMNEIAQLTYNQSDFVEVMEMLDKRLNDKGKNWRHVFKALTLLDYCLHAGSENVVIYFKDNLYIIKTLKEFVYIDDLDKDVGANVRQKAKDITNLLQDEERLRQERRSRGAMQDRMAGVSRRSADDDNENIHRRPTEVARRKPTRNNDEDADMQKAIRESLSADDDGARKRREQEESELAKVLEMSEKEERDRKREEDERIRRIDEQNSKALFDDSLQLQGQNAYQQPDLFAQQTSYNQQQPQPTGGWPLVDTSFGQGSQFNPFYQQQQQQQQQQAEQQALAQQQYLQMQYQAQQEQQAREQAAAQQAYLYQQQLQQQQQQQQLVPQPTGYGSNNPFAMGFQPQPQHPQFTGFQAPPSPQPQAAPPMPVFQNPPPSQAPPSPMKQAPRPTKSDGENARLAALLANGREDGLDTFGNIGSLRMPGQRTGQNNPFGRMQSPQQQQPQQQQQQQSGNLVDF